MFHHLLSLNNIIIAWSSLHTLCVYYFTYISLTTSTPHQPLIPLIYNGNTSTKHWNFGIEIPICDRGQQALPAMH